MKILFAMLSLFGLAACAGPRESVVTETHFPGLFTGHTANIGVMTTSASHRAVIFQNKGPKDSPYCAEPPPDAMESISSRLATEVGASAGSIPLPVVPGGTITSPQITVNLDRGTNTAVAAILRRSQGLQWGRDQMAYLCHDHLNGRLSTQEFTEQRRKILEVSEKLILAEIDKLPEVTSAIIQATQVPRGASTK